MMDAQQTCNERANGHPPRRVDNPGMLGPKRVEAQEVGIARNEDPAMLLSERQLPRVVRSQHAGFPACKRIYPTAEQPLCHRARHVLVEVKPDRFSQRASLAALKECLRASR